MPKIVVLISGSGSNLQALIDASTDEPKKLNGNITRVISSSPKAYGLKRAEKSNIPTTIHSLKTYYKDISKESKEERKIARDKFDADLADLIIKEKPDLVVCAGWMLILSLSFLNPLSKENIPIINLHPALPGAFEGTHAIERSWEAGQKGEITKGGCMIHYVIEEVDLGKPLVVKELEVIKGESVEEWEEKIHKLEHIAIVEGAELALEEANLLKKIKDVNISNKEQDKEKEEEKEKGENITSV
jgi:phosphoribosylglycinamide formyltransferase